MLLANDLIIMLLGAAGASTNLLICNLSCGCAALNKAKNTCMG